jgi:hypothetical protein
MGRRNRLAAVADAVAAARRVVDDWRAETDLWSNVAASEGLRRPRKALGAVVGYRLRRQCVGPGLVGSDPAALDMVTEMPLGLGFFVGPDHPLRADVKGHRVEIA